MAYYGGGSVFSGFPGGYSQTPAGFPNANLGFGGSGMVHTIGMNLPSVDPNNFPGTVHFGPPTIFSGQGYGQFPPSADFTNANIYAGGGANFYPGL